MNLRPKQRKKSKETYDGQFKAALANVYEIFDYLCDQRLRPILEVEIDRLRKLGELFVDQFTEEKIKDPKIIEFSRRVDVVPDPELDKLGINATDFYRCRHSYGSP